MRGCVVHVRSCVPTDPANAPALPRRPFMIRWTERRCPGRAEAGGRSAKNVYGIRSKPWLGANCVSRRLTANGWFMGSFFPKTRPQRRSSCGLPLRCCGARFRRDTFASWCPYGARLPTVADARARQGSKARRIAWTLGWTMGEAPSWGTAARGCDGFNCEPARRQAR